jgi:hypothetical protein
MKILKFILILFIAASKNCISAEYRHMISFGTQGLGWSGAAEKIHSDSGSDFDGIEYLFHNIGLNYAYRLTSRLQLGGFYQAVHQEYRFKTANDVSRSENKSNSIGLFGIYNFSDELTNTFFLGLSIANFRMQEENSHDILVAESKNPFELDDSGVTYELILGKRFTLKKWGIEHLTFSPQGSVYHRTHGKDFSDQRSKEGVGLTLQVIKFDLLF